MVLKEYMVKLLLLNFIYLFTTNIDLVPIEINMEAILCSVARPRCPAFLLETTPSENLGLVLLSSCVFYKAVGKTIHVHNLMTSLRNREMGLQSLGS